MENWLLAVSCQLSAFSNWQSVETFSFQFSIFNFQLVALGIGAASFWSEAEKDIAESPTRSGTPR